MLVPDQPLPCAGAFALHNVTLPVLQCRSRRAANPPRMATTSAQPIQIRANTMHLSESRSATRFTNRAASLNEMADTPPAGALVVTRSLWLHADYLVNSRLESRVVLTRNTHPECSRSGRSKHIVRGAPSGRNRQSVTMRRAQVAYTGFPEFQFLCHHLMPFFPNAHFEISPRYIVS